MKRVTVIDPATGREVKVRADSKRAEVWKQSTPKAKPKKASTTSKAAPKAAESEED